MTNVTLLSTIPTETLKAFAEETTISMANKAEEESFRDCIAVYELGGEKAAVTFAAALLTLEELFSRLSEETTFDSNINFRVRWAMGVWKSAISGTLIKLTGKAIAADVTSGGNFFRQNPLIDGFIQGQEALRTKSRQAIETDLQAGRSFADMFSEIEGIITGLAAPSESEK